MIESLSGWSKYRSYQTYLKITSVNMYLYIQDDEFTRAFDIILNHQVDIMELKKYSQNEELEMDLPHLDTIEERLSKLKG